MKYKTFIQILKEKWARRSGKSLIDFYRGKGVRIGNGCIFRYPYTVHIDTMRPSLITIGDNVDMNRNFGIKAHDFGHRVFIPLYGEFLSSSGKVTIGSNIYFGTDVTVLKGVTIGDNCIIGAGSIVSKSIPSNSVAAGVPCRVICTIEEYYKKRNSLWVDEAISYAKAIREREQREPTINDFIPEFALFIDKRNIDQFDNSFIKARLKEHYSLWIENHVAPFSSFEEFMEKTRD